MGRVDTWHSGDSPAVLVARQLLANPSLPLMSMAPGCLAILMLEDRFSSDSAPSVFALLTETREGVVYSPCTPLDGHGQLQPERCQFNAVM